MYFLLLGKSVDIVSSGALLLTLCAVVVGVYAVLTAPAKATSRKDSCRSVSAHAEFAVQDAKTIDAKWRNKVALFALICYLVFLAALVFLPIGNADGVPSGMSRGGFSWEISYKKLFSHRVFILNTVINFLLFFLLGMLVALQTRGRFRLIKTVALCAAVSVTIELAQLLVPTRASDACDILVNVTGAFFGALPIFVFKVD